MIRIKLLVVNMTFFGATLLATVYAQGRKLDDVNTTDIKDAIELGCLTMQHVFNADDNNFPFMGSQAWPDAYLAFSGYHGESHIPGRHLNALLNAVDATGIAVDPVAVENHSRAAFFSYNGSLPLPLNRQEVGGELVNFCPHNIREGFHALYALVKYRKSEQAYELAEKSIDCILELWDPDKGWNLDLIEKQYHLHYQKCLSFVHGLGRSLGPLVKYYKVTGSPKALDLATLIKDKLIDEFYQPEGNYDEPLFGRHSHSVTCCLSSLAQMAELTGDMSLMNSVRAFYDNGLWQLRDKIGWSPESATQIATGQTDHGESNNTGDILETALILARYGYPGYYDDAELMLRAHLLPSQLRDVSFIREPENPDNLDGLRDMAQRQKGAWGFPAPYGHKSINEGRHGSISFNMDIVGGVVGSLCEAYRQVAFFDELGHHVNLLFDHETPDIRIESPYTHESLKITLHRTGPVFIRIPAWVDHDQLQLSDCPTNPVWKGNRLYFSQLPAGSTIDLHFPLPERIIIMSRNHIHPIRVRLKGDSVIAMDNFGADFTFFNPVEIVN